MSIFNFDKFFESNNEETNDKFDKIVLHNKEWKSSYPEIKMFKLEYDSDDKNKEYNWLYSLNKKHDSISIDAFIEISYYKNWKIDFEMVIESTDETDSMYQDEKHHTLANLNYDELKIELSKICSFIRKWNKEYFNTHNFYPLID
jgi:hypothetical protein